MSHVVNFKNKGFQNRALYFFLIQNRLNNVNYVRATSVDKIDVLILPHASKILPDDKNNIAGFFDGYKNFIKMLNG